jgi:transposase
MFDTANAARFVRWVRTKLLPKLRRGDVVVMDNAKAHHDSRVVSVGVLSLLCIPDIAVRDRVV